MGEVSLEYGFEDGDCICIWVVFLGVVDVYGIVDVDGVDGELCELRGGVGGAEEQERSVVGCAVG